ncbi:MAG: alpha/beta fold hydrolase [Gammaproteobacteria bacterium]|nr:alpha/beta fold hydrolase [Gammaproteobacteria bacterium]
MNPFPAEEQRIDLQGPAGVLQAIAAAPKDAGNGPGNVTIVCHPHSLMGGTMDNKVVHTVARARRDCGHRTVRFNFRGVAGSAGAFDHGMGESDDLLAVIDWVRQVRPEDRIWLAGFSFGSFVAARTCARAVERGDPIDHLLLIAPAVVNYDFGQLQQFPVPLQLIYGDADEVVDSQEIRHWSEGVQSRKSVHCLPGAGHFFHGRLTELKEILQQTAPA